MKYLRHTIHNVHHTQVTIFIMREDGKSFARVYWFTDGAKWRKLGVLDSLSVKKSIRNKGEGTRLQKLREGILRKLGKKYAWLWVRKGTWMLEWYERRGYKVQYAHRKEKGCVWMKKKL